MSGFVHFCELTHFGMKIIPVLTWMSDVNSSLSSGTCPTEPLSLPIHALSSLLGASRRLCTVPAPLGTDHTIARSLCSAEGGDAGRSAGRIARGPPLWSPPIPLVALDIEADRD